MHLSIGAGHVDSFPRECRRVDQLRDSFEAKVDHWMDVMVGMDIAAGRRLNAMTLLVHV